MWITGPKNPKFRKFNGLKFGRFPKAEDHFFSDLSTGLFGIHSVCFCGALTGYLNILYTSTSDWPVAFEISRKKSELSSISKTILVDWHSGQMALSMNISFRKLFQWVLIRTVSRFLCSPCSPVHLTPINEHHPLNGGGSIKTLDQELIFGLLWISWSAISTGISEKTDQKHQQVGSGFHLSTWWFSQPRVALALSERPAAWWWKRSTTDMGFYPGFLAWIMISSFGTFSNWRGIIYETFIWTWVCLLGRHRVCGQIQGYLFLWDCSIRG